MTTELEQLRSVGLPSLIGQRIGKQFWGEDYVIFPWIKYMEQRVVEAIMDTSHERYLAIAAPPQTGKSSYMAILLPFWITGMFPDWQVMYLSYSDDFSTARGKDVQALHKRYGRQFFGSSIDPDFSSGADWRIKDHRGGMLSAGIGGQITGRPGHIILVDDLIKNAEEARSQATKRKHLAEWNGTVDSRMQPGGTAILIATRWAEDDLQGSLREQMAEPGYEGPPWEFLEFPAFAEPPENVDLTEEELKDWRDPLGRKFGEVLDCRFSRIPGREPEDFFRLVRAKRDLYAWTALYQQHPSVREGGLFPRSAWVYEDIHTWPHMTEITRVWDLAVTEDGGDFTVGCRVGRGEDGRMYIMDVKRFRRAPGDVQVAVELAAKLDGFSTHIQIEEEKGGCLDGETPIRLGRAGKSFIVTIGDLYRRFHGLDQRYRWNPTFPTLAGRAIGDVVRLGRIADVVATGEKPCWKIRTLDGRSLVGSADHPVLTKDGDWVGLADLSAGMMIAVRGQQGRGRPRQPKSYDVKVYGMRHHPHHHRAKMVGREGNGYYVAEHRLMAEAELNRLGYGEYLARVRSGNVDGLTFLSTKLWDVHHVNGDHGDNRIDNLEVLSRSAHRRGHADPDARMYRIDYHEILAVEPVGTRETFDIVMADEPHNFIANEFVVHNSGKTVTEFYRKLLPGWRVTAAKAEGDKVSRATPYASQQNAMKVVLPLPDQVGWSVKDFVDEHSKLMADGRGPRNDDQIDTAAYAVASLVGAVGVDMWVPGDRPGISPEAQVRALLADPITIGAGVAW